MKISIGAEIKKGPFGGGNSFVKNLTETLEINGHSVVHNLKDTDIDIALLINPLITSETSTFSNFDIDFYQKFVNPNLISVQRINECDERKQTNYVNKQIIKHNKNIDFNFFVSDWIRGVFEGTNLHKKPYKVIMGGPDNQIINNKDLIKLSHNEKIKIVTHHWSSNYLKGFDIYKQLDELLQTNEWASKLEFTYIGNLSEDISFKKTRLISALSGNELANELKNHHIYITASRNEPSGNHHMEAAMIGLPLLYIKSGAIPEYCNGFGVEFNESNFVESLKVIINDHSKYANNLKNYPYSFDYAYNQIIESFNFIVDNREKLKKKREKIGKSSILFNYYLYKLKKIIYRRKIQLMKFAGYHRKRIFK